MVGRILFPSSRDGGRVAIPDETNSPPPSYAESDSAQSFLAETVTTTVTTTRTTHTTTTSTHFLSLPSIRRRVAPSLASVPTASNGTRLLMPDNTVDDSTHLRPISFNLDKDLPALPATGKSTSSIESHSRNSKDGTPTHNFIASGLSTQYNSASPSKNSSLTLPSSHPTHTLAQTALGIGLPHVMPQATASTSQIDDFPLLIGPSSQLVGPYQSPKAQSLRDQGRSLSEGFIFVGSDTTQHRIESPLHGNEASKVKTQVFLTSASESKEEVVVTSPSVTRSLMRRASFWNRRRVQSLKNQPDTDKDTEQSVDRLTSIPLPSLPRLQPVSPLFGSNEVTLCTSLESSELSSPMFSPRLRRRHSERGTSFSSSRISTLDSSTVAELPTPTKKLPKRPSTSVGITSSSTHIDKSHSPSPSRPSITTSTSTFSPSAFSRQHSELSAHARPRSMTSPSNLLHRLSMGFIPLSTTSTPISSPIITHVLDHDFTSSPSRSSASLPRISLSRSQMEIPTPKTDEETPASFLERLQEAVSKAEIANVLASSADPFYTSALREYIGRFEFTGDALDIALRKLLMDVGLPKETQQIDRVIEAFAARYTECNPGLFVSEDHPYILSFSIIMLHTDAFNRSNKRKMSKADYIKNTKLVGVPTEVLGYFFDNVTFAPFIFIEDPVDINGQRGLTQDDVNLKLGPSSLSSPSPNSNSMPVLGRSSKIDPYYLITQNRHRSLQVNLEILIPKQNPYIYSGTHGSLNNTELRQSSSKPDMVELVSLDDKRLTSMPYFSLGIGGASGPAFGGFSGVPYSPDPSGNSSELASFKVTKVGLLNRKEDLSDGGKRSSNRKWREWSVLLTGSQLLFFRDGNLALDLILQLKNRKQETDIMTPRTSLLRPEELISVKDAVAVRDETYTKHENTFRFIMVNGRQILLQTESEQQRNEWISLINYASAFKTAGLRMRFTYSAISDTRFPTALQENSGFDNAAPSTSRSRSQSLPGDIVNSQSRARILRGKLNELEERIETLQKQLDAEMRIVRNIAVLTPFQRSTRERLQIAAGQLAKDVRQLRIEITKNKCYRDVLMLDYLTERRERAARRMNEVTKLGEHYSSPDNAIFQPAAIALPLKRTAESDSLLPPQDLRDDTSSKGASSICDSFHSALDLVEVSPNASTMDAIDNSLEEPRSGAPDRQEHNSQVSRALSSDTLLKTGHSQYPAVLQEQALSTISNSDTNQMSFTDEIEVAEQWDKTRAAKRVSLVKIPPSVRTFYPSQKHPLDVLPHSNTIPEDEQGLD